MKDLNELRDRAYKTACEHGFHKEELSDKHLLMLVITELCEAIEADRKGKKIDIKQFECGISYPKNDFKQVYEYCIKGSVEEELADAAIRLLDLAGLRNIEVHISGLMDEKISSSFKDIPFTECVYDIIDSICSFYPPTTHCINITLASIFALAKSKDIDLLWHIEAKMRYNQNRPYRHGKKY
jgi:NTP pyrophosphatase (non-canonical NTP hydrolase)